MEDGRDHAREQGSAVAWVESPLQMLCAVEAHHAGLLGPRTRLVPRARLRPLAVTGRELDHLDLPPGLELTAPEPDVPRPRRGATWAVGDAFSGKVQARWLTAFPGRTVIVDDGLATIRLLELLTAPAGTPLLRARGRSGRLRTLLGVAAGFRLRAAARAGRLSIFTALPVPEELARAVRDRGAELVTHDFAWLRSQPLRGPRPAERTVVLGTSLVRNGLIHRDHYFTWLAGLGSAGPVAYFPHRREDPDDLVRVGEQPGITVYDGGMPAEMTLRGLAAEQRVLSLPSTAVTSLRVLLSARGVAVETVDVPDEWWTTEAAPSLRSHLSMFAHHDTGVTG
ncbi:hypothetical protein FHS43_001412 [Streptosporangium becharense]|uniref:Uncharacterized protein n=1 Tax=Streptosporangium becharense TaxID=1816182 RepID=A0A7W9ILH3_9ACTN|nr:hypothetical protein [Streptosporangium becharense]MBB2910149.1 hypothetical protein [Streptosporangium becharense]MBB5822892.1 hypothetical protein [Streptosporangium becharense]